MKDPYKWTACVALLGGLVLTGASGYQPSRGAQKQDTWTRHREEALMTAVSNEDALQIPNLIAGARPENLQLALLSAARRGNVSISNMLLAAGADPNSGIGGPSETPLLIATLLGRDGVAKALIVAGADPNGRAGPGNCAPIHVAAANGQNLVLAVLLAHRGDANVRCAIDEHMRLGGPGALDATPLMLAAGTGNLVGVETLLSSGADPRLVDKRGKTAEEWLQSYKARVDTIRARLRKAEGR